MSAEEILALLTGHDSRNPLAFDLLLEKSGVGAGRLNLLLDNMYRAIPAMINRCQITRSGVTHFVYWPTGMVEKAARQSIVINPNKVPPSGFIQTPARLNPARKKDKPIHDMETSMQPIRNQTKVSLILEFMFNNGASTNAMLAKAGNTRTPSTFLLSYIASGLVTVKGNAPNKIYRIADGVTREMLQTAKPHACAMSPRVESAGDEISVDTTTFNLVPFEESGAPPYRSPFMVHEVPAHKEQDCADSDTDFPDVDADETVSDTDKSVFGIEKAPAPVAAEPVAEESPVPAVKPDNVRQFKRPDHPVALPIDPGRQFSYQHCGFDAEGQFVIRNTDLGSLVFPLEDTIRIQKLFLAIDLESLRA